MTVGAILLAGGRSRRVGGAAKPLFTVRGRTLLERSLAAVSDCVPLTVVSDPVPGWDTSGWVREEPPFGGPVAGIVAALRSWSDDPDWTFVLACDLPGVEEAARRLEGARRLVPADTDGVCLADPSSRPQWLTGMYRTAALRRAVAELPQAGRGASMRDAVADLAIAVIEAPATETTDIDTWDDLHRERARDEEER